MFPNCNGGPQFGLLTSLQVLWVEDNHLEEFSPVVYSVSVCLSLPSPPPFNAILPLWFAVCCALCVAPLCFELVDARWTASVCTGL